MPEQVKPKRILRLKDKQLNQVNQISYIGLTDFQSDKKLANFKIHAIRQALQQYKLSTEGNTYTLRKRLKDYLACLDKYSKDISNIVKIQRFIRNNLHLFKPCKRGPGYNNPKLCVNECDFYTCETLGELDMKYFISYKDNDNFVYWFDVRSIIKLSEYSNGIVNPFSMKPIPDKVITYAKEIADELKNTNNYESNEDVLTDEQIFQNRIVDIFSKIDELDNYTNSEWFSSLSLYHLKSLYSRLYFIWKQRAELNDYQRNIIVPNYKKMKLLAQPIGKISAAKSQRELQILLLDTFEKLISSAVRKDDRVLGAMYILSALAQVSKGCADTYYWLV